ncbi:MAG TPA: sulfur carrier protein ThiS [Rhodanobacteraceae bacterium]
MQIFLNGETHACAAAITVAQLLDEAGYGNRRVAVEVNREIVPRSQHSQHALSEGDRVEIVQAIGGG